LSSLIRGTPIRILLDGTFSYASSEKFGRGMSYPIRLDNIYKRILLYPPKILIKLTVSQWVISCYFKFEPEEKPLWQLQQTYGRSPV